MKLILCFYYYITVLVRHCNVFFKSTNIKSNELYFTEIFKHLFLHLNDEILIN